MTGPRTARARAWWLAPIALAAWAASGFYSVQSDESAVPFRFGKAAEQESLPGIHWNPPWPVGRIVVARTTTSFVMPIGYRFVDRPAEPSISDMWLTGDTNVATARLTVQYSIDSLADFELSHESPRELVRRAGERTLTEYLVGRGVDGVLTTERARMAAAVKTGIQARLDEASTGIAVQSVNVQELAPPLAGGVRNAFQEVQNASADRERAIHEARAYAAQTVASAAGMAEKLTNEARARRHERIEQAKGETARFTAIAREHGRAPEVTENRLYLEALDRLLPSMETYIVEPGRNGKVNLRILR